RRLAARPEHGQRRRWLLVDGGTVRVRRHRGSPAPRGRGIVADRRRRGLARRPGRGQPTRRRPDRSWPTPPDPDGSARSRRGGDDGWWWLGPPNTGLGARLALGLSPGGPAWS